MTSASLTAGLSLAALDTLAEAAVSAGAPAKCKLRFAIASDGHYGEPKTDYKTTHANIITWLNQEHKRNALDFVIFNGDLVHDQPALLKELRSDYLSKLSVHTMPFQVTTISLRRRSGKRISDMKTIFRLTKTGWPLCWQTPQIPKENMFAQIMSLFKESWKNSAV